MAAHRNAGERRVAPASNAPTGRDASRAALLQAGDAEGVAFVDHEKERRRPGLHFASSQAGEWQRGPRASTRPRWPVDAKTPLKAAKVFSPPAEASARQGGQGF